MATPHASTTSASHLLGMPVVDGHGRAVGRVAELSVVVERDAEHVDAVLLRTKETGKNERVVVDLRLLTTPRGETGKLHVKGTVPPAQALAAFDDALLLDRDLLDQQIIDVDGHKVVRVNDVNLLWESDGTDTRLRIAEVEVGMRGALRRLLKGMPAGFVESLATKFRTRAIPWNCVDLIERDPRRRVKLKIGQDRLAKMHPSDIAAILEELAPAEREAIFTSLPEETAAETLEEVAPKLQRELVEGLGSEHAADIIEEMDPAAAADLLAELSDEASEAILEEMEPEERQDVEELLEHEGESAAGRMTTDFVAVPETATVADVVAALREFEGDVDTITEIYLVNEEGKWHDVVALGRLLLASSDTKVASMAEGHRVSCHLDARDVDVAELFDKYNLRSLPVIDHHGCLAGVIHAEQVIAQLMER